MKTFLKISLLLNLGLLGILVFLWTGGRPVAPQPAPAPVQAQTPAPAAAPAVAVQAPPAPKPFHWDQLAAADYAGFVRNLRDSGCPERTLRAIVTSDFDVLYANRRHELEQQITALETGSWSDQLASYDTRTELHSQIADLPGQEIIQIDQVLGITPPPAPEAPTVQLAQAPAAGPAVNAAPPSTYNPNAGAIKPVTQPLALQTVDLTSLNFNDKQMAAINQVRQQFLEDVGGANQDPNDPAYRARWEQAQPDADSLLLGKLGADAYSQYELVVHQQSLQQQ